MPKSRAKKPVAPDVQFDAVNEVADAKAARKRRQAFYTPPALVARLVEWANVSEHTRCLEPSAGDGRIVHRLRLAGAVEVDACEVEPAMHDRIRAAGGTVVAADFLTHDPGPVYDRIVMNPPFAGKTCDRHIEHAWTLLRPGGRLLSVAPPPTADRLVECKLNLPGCADATFERLEAAWFKEFGTGIKVVVVELNKDPSTGSAAVEGFQNWATYNAALTLANDRELSARWVSHDSPFGEPFNPAVRKAIAESGGSVYGINWREVAEYMRPAPAPEKPAASQRSPAPDLFAGVSP